MKPLAHASFQINTRLIVWIAVGLLSTGLIVAAGASGLVHLSLSRHAHDLTAIPAALPPLPRLQSDPVQDSLNYFAAETDKLNSYGWVNRAQRRARIPIGVAMRRMAARGWPTADADEGEVPSPERTGRPAP